MQVNCLSHPVICDAVAASLVCSQARIQQIVVAKIRTPPPSPLRKKQTSAYEEDSDDSIVKIRYSECKETDPAQIQSAPLFPLKDVVANASCVPFVVNKIIHRSLSYLLAACVTRGGYQGRLLPLNVGVHDCCAYLRSHLFGSNRRTYQKSKILASPISTCTYANM